MGSLVAALRLAMSFLPVQVQVFVLFVIAVVVIILVFKLVSLVLNAIPFL